MKKPEHILYGPDGNPLDSISDAEIKSDGKKGKAARSSVRKAYATYLSALYNLDAEPIFRSTEPFENHAWVYSTAMTRAINLSQAPYLLYREKETTVTRRRELAKKNGQYYTAKSGKGRRAVHRHLTKSANPSRFQGMKMKSLEQDLNHPLMDVLSRPNPLMTSAQLWQATELWMALAGEVIWLKLKEDGTRLENPTDQPGQIYPLNPQLFKPIKRSGGLVGWLFNPGGFQKDSSNILNMSENQSSHTHEIILDDHECIQFAYYNPMDMFRGFSPLTSTAGTINLDLMAKAHNRAVLQNGADPGGILIDESAVEPWTSSEEEEFLSRWEQRHKGPNNSQEMAVLTGGLKYVPIGLSPQDMQHLETAKYNREEIFAVQRVPKTVVGITDSVNYATQLGQDANFWDKCLIPEIRYFEDNLDSTLLSAELDTVVGAFDLSGVEALRQGLGEKVATVLDLTSNNIHMPPEQAFNIVGIDIEEYEGSDTSFVQQGLLPVEEATDSSTRVPEVTEPPPESPSFEPAPPEEEDVVENVATAFKQLSDRKKLNYHNKIYNELWGPIESNLARTWRSWVNGERKRAIAVVAPELQNLSAKEGVLKVFGEVMGQEEAEILADQIADMIMPLGKADSIASTSLSSAFNTQYAASAEGIFDWTVSVDIGGSSVMDLDDPRIVGYVSTQGNVLKTSATNTIRKNIVTVLTDALVNGEPIDEVMNRIGAVYSLSGSSSKALSVARTETGGLLNGIRDILHQANDINTFQWSSALDGNVRPSHKVFGASGPRPRGFNYLRLVGKSGMLARPHDGRAPSSEIVNCRCVLVPSN